MNKMIMVVYNEAVDQEVMEAVEDCGIAGYTKTLAVFGKGAASGTHLGNYIWPGRNNMLFIACEDKESKQLLIRIRNLRKTIGREGVKAFILPIEDVT